MLTSDMFITSAAVEYQFCFSRSICSHKVLVKIPSLLRLCASCRAIARCAIYESVLSRDTQGDLVKRSPDSFHEQFQKERTPAAALQPPEAVPAWSSMPVQLSVYPYSRIAHRFLICLHACNTRELITKPFDACPPLSTLALHGHRKGVMRYRGHPCCGPGWISS